MFFLAWFRFGQNSAKSVLAQIQPTRKIDTPLIAARVPGLGATRPPHHGAWSTGTEVGTGKRRCFHIPGLLVAPCARSLQQERQGRTSEAQPRSNERTFVNAWLKSPTARAASPLRRPTPSGCRSPEPREGSIRQGTAQHHHRRIYHQHAHHTTTACAPTTAPSLAQEQSLARG